METPPEESVGGSSGTDSPNELECYGRSKVPQYGQGSDPCSDGIIESFTFEGCGMIWRRGSGDVDDNWGSVQSEETGEELWWWHAEPTREGDGCWSYTERGRRPGCDELIEIPYEEEAGIGGFAGEASSC